MLRRLLIVTLLSAVAAAQARAPERKVDGTTLSSERAPKVKIELPRAVTYVGSSRWNLYDVADCELHAFAEADSQKRVERLYWIQFEGYLPSKPELAHTYDSPRHLTIAGMDFYVDTWVRKNDAEVIPGSDREHIESLLQKKGYTNPPSMMYVRLVHLLDPQKRRELMIIYGEDLAPTGLTAADLEPKGRAYDHWPEIERRLIERAQKQIKIEPSSSKGE